MNIAFRLLVASFVLPILGGCATSRSSLDIAPLASSDVAQPSGKTVFINSAKDKRIFQVAPPSADIPSLDPSEEQSDAIRLRAVGRKRNGFGKALGDILLKEGKTVETLTTTAISQAFVEKGYNVVDKKEEVTGETYTVDANIEKFWAWMNPGFWSITLSAEISTNLTIKSADGTAYKNVSVKAADGYQVATEGNWIEVIEKALRLYVDDLKSQLR